MRDPKHKSPRVSRGGKADSLLRLSDDGVRVPPFAVIFHEDLLAGDIEVLATVAADELPHAATYAVRSSANLEDGARHSFAGLFGTLLHVRREDLPAAISQVWASAKTERVAAYLNERGLDPQALAMNVVVQEMVAAEASGVAFGADPVSGLLDATVVSAVRGLGEALVDGTLDGDQYFVDARRRPYTLATAHQDRQLILDAEAGGTRWTTVNETGPVLTETQLREVDALTRKLNTAAGTPQDVEFAFADGQLYALQSRPITTLAPPQERRVFDNANIVESYPGLTLPLTFSFIQKMYASVYRQLSGVLGVRPERVAQFPAVYDNMLAHLNGRVYYDLNNWYAALSLLPGYRLNAPAMERMMGVTESLDLPPLPSLGAWRARFDLARGALGMLRSYRRLARSRHDFDAMFEETIRRYRAIDLADLTDRALLEAYDGFETTLVQRWRAPLVNDFFAMMAFSALQGLGKKWGVPDADGIHNDLLAGSGDIVSTEPARRTLDIVAAIAADPATSDALETLDDEGFWRKLNQDDGLRAHRQRIHAYLDEWGARTMGELKLETVTYEQQPTDFIRLLRAYLQQSLHERQRDSGVAAELRSAAEAKARGHLSGWRWRVYRYVLGKTRELVSARENLRFARTRGFAMVRKMMLEVGGRLARAQVLAKAADVFYLPQHSVLEAVRHLEDDERVRDLRSEVERIRGAYEEHARVELPERISVRGDVEAALQTLRRVHDSTSAVPPKDDGRSDAELRGTPCCPGVVRARARVITDPTDVDNLAGGILVTHSTDPGWIALFPSASAILVERGSLLSHAAIVSREFGIPCVVGVRDLLATVRDGDELELDGSTGRVQILRHGA